MKKKRKILIIIEILLLIIIVGYITALKTNLVVRQPTIDNIEMKVKEKTLTSTSATIIIVDKNLKPFIYEEWFKIEEEKSNGEWKELECIQNEGIVRYFNSIGYIVNKDKKIEIKQDWSNIYGELKKGKYRLVKKVKDDESGYFWVEFNL